MSFPSFTNPMKDLLARMGKVAHTSTVVQKANRSGGVSTDGDVVGGRSNQSLEKGQVEIKYNGMTITGRNISIGGKKIVVNGVIVDPDFKPKA